MKRKTLLLLFAVLLLATATSRAVEPGENILINPGFELGDEGWSARMHQGSPEDVDLIVADDVVRSGEKSGALVSRSSSVRAKWAQIYTPELGELKKGETYRAEVWFKSDDMTYGSPGVVARLTSSTQGWKDYQDVTLEPILEKDGWTLLSGTLTLELESPWNLMLELFSWRASGSVWFDDAKLIYDPGEELEKAVETQAREVDTWWPRKTVRPTPADGEVVATTPPSFLWPPVSGASGYELEISQTQDFSDPETIRVLDVTLNMYTPATTLAAGTWYWRMRTVGAEGSAAWSTARQFIVPETAVEFPLPPMSEIMARIPAERPRIFVRHENLEEFRAARFGEKRLLWQVVSSSLAKYRVTTWMEEPPPYPNEKWDPDLWRQYMTDSRSMGGAIQSLAFGYLVTGDRSYAEKAKEGLLEFASWDPEGTTSWSYNDEPAMSVIQYVPRAYDWIHDTLSEEERQLILDAMRMRGEQLYDMFRSIPYEEHPFTSHPTRTLKFLGQAGIAFLGELPEAEKWLNYVINVFYAIYSPWGDTDGSYSEGPNYWKWYIGWALEFADALKTATGIDLYQKPFFQNTGYYKLYMNPPYSQMSPFGDGSDGKPNSTDYMNLHRLASVYNDPYLEWYAEQVSGGPLMGMMAYFWLGTDIKGKSPTDLPQSRAFFDTGLVGMHTALADGAEDVMFLFKSSPYGSQSHGYAEQNTFYLQAFGEPLAISSGYYPYSNSPHHLQWTRQTMAHNGILVNGQGQAVLSPEAAGEIKAFTSLGGYDYTVGDATRAYGFKLNRALRHVLFGKPEYLAIFDDLAAPQLSTYTWSLHALSKMAVDATVNSVLVTEGAANLRVQFVDPAALEFAQTDQFTVPPENGAPNQWHLTATTKDKAANGSFLTILIPYKSADGDQIGEIVGLESPSGWAAAQISGPSWTDTVTFAGMDAEAAEATVGQVRTNAQAASVRMEDSGTISRWFIQAGTELAVAGRALLSSDVPVSAAFSAESEADEVAIQTAERAQITLHAAKRPEQLAVVEGTVESWSYSEQEGSLVLVVSAGEVQVRL